MKKSHMLKIARIIEYMFFDAFAIILPYLIAVVMFKFLDINISWNDVLIALPFVIVFKILIFYMFGFYQILMTHVGFEDFIKIAIAVSFTNIVIVIYIAISGHMFMYKSAYVFITMAEIAFVLSPRIINRMVLYLKINYDWARSTGNRTMIIGAGSAGELALKEIFHNKTLKNIPVVFLDDDEKKFGNRLLGIPIVGPIKLVKEYITQFEIQEIILAIKDYPKDKMQKLIDDISSVNIKMKQLISIEDLSSEDKLKIVDIKIEDLLNRHEIKLDDTKIVDLIQNETVLVTGGGGSIGSELCRQIAKLKPKKLIIFDIYENNAYEIQMELHRTFEKKKEKLELEVIIGSVYNRIRLEHVFQTYHPTLVFHAAAYKHVPLMEDSAVEAVRTNVLGTYNAASLSNQYGVKKFVLVSSDKAVRSTNIMGATKRYAELVIQDQHNVSQGTKFAAVRFGNVLGSNGSVIPLFKKQIEDGGPVTVTHPEITRFFMTIPEAVGLILQCGVYANGGEVFVLDMGEPVLIKDLAEQMIRLSGFKPYQEIDIIYTGLRPGEKLYEELLVSHDLEQEKTENQKIFIEKQRAVTHEELKIEEITNGFEKLDNDGVKDFVAKVIETYQRNGIK
ncbi:MAG: nucleoside-diphosphate sugar epimerase/dehydratase [Acholeplasmataceae bacterium]|jgi:FlaA1/EpsC-like NDP-sugar epimerase|nr:nucleoside-diphosphate sugar epimerase/dehydratase [Acholeplasmataceae bacterium]